MENRKPKTAKAKNDSLMKKLLIKKLYQDMLFTVKQERTIDKQIQVFLTISLLLNKLRRNLHKKKYYIIRKQLPLHKKIKKLTSRKLPVQQETKISSKKHSINKISEMEHINKYSTRTEFETEDTKDQDSEDLEQDLEEVAVQIIQTEEHLDEINRLIKNWGNSDTNSQESNDCFQDLDKIILNKQYNKKDFTEILEDLKTNDSPISKVPDNSREDIAQNQEDPTENNFLLNIENINLINKDVSQSKHLESNFSSFETNDFPSIEETAKNEEKTVKNIEDPVRNIDDRGAPDQNPSSIFEPSQSSFEAIQTQSENIFVQKIRVRDPSELGCPQWCPTPTTSEEPSRPPLGNNVPPQQPIHVHPQVADEFPTSRQNDFLPPSGPVQPSSLTSHNQLNLRPLFANDSSAMNCAEIAGKHLVNIVKCFVNPSTTEDLKVCLNSLIILLEEVSKNTIILRQMYQGRPLGMCSPEIHGHNLILSMCLENIAIFLNHGVKEDIMKRILQIYADLTGKPILNDVELVYIIHLPLR